MAFQTVFKRYELKYIITGEQKEKILHAMNKYMKRDKYGRTVIRNIYFDTDDFILARHSIAKPDFKEKMRIRSYGRASADSTVFVELKRKFDHVVYKRRIPMSESDAMKWTAGVSADSGEKSQIRREIDYFLSYYGNLHPVAFLSYEREAYKMLPQYDSDFRVTFDENLLFRDSDISLNSEVYGKPVLREGKILMELKCSGGIPMWMTKVLSEEHVYKTSFSKYGTAYKCYIQPALADRRRKMTEKRADEPRNRRGVHPEKKGAGMRRTGWAAFRHAMSPGA